MLQQRRAIASALLLRIDADHGQIPVRLGRMITVHLFEQRKYVGLIPLGNAMPQQRKERVVVGMDTRWEPERRG